MVCVATVLSREKVRLQTWWFNHFTNLSIKKVGLKRPNLYGVLKELPFKKAVLFSLHHCVQPQQESFIVYNESFVLLLLRD